MCQQEHQKQCGPYQQSATSKLLIPRLISSSPASGGQTKAIPSSQEGPGPAAELHSAKQHQHFCPNSIHWCQHSLYAIDVCRVTLDKRIQYSSDCTWLGRKKINILHGVLAIFSFAFLFSKAKSVISPSLTHHRMEAADTLLLHYILTFSPH